MPNQSSAHFKKDSDNSASLALQQTNTDSPILYIPDPDRVARLVDAAPDLLPWMMKQTNDEADYRRAIDSSNMKSLARERLLGQFFGFAIGMFGILAGALVAIYGSATAGGTIASVAIGTLAVAFIRRE